MSDVKVYIRYADLNITNLSENSILIKGYGFEDVKGKIKAVPILDSNYTSNLSLSGIDFNSDQIVDMGERISLIHNKRFIDPFDSVYVYYNLEILERILDNETLYFYFNDSYRKKKIKIVKKMISI